MSAAAVWGLLLCRPRPPLTPQRWREEDGGSEEGPDRAGGRQTVSGETMDDTVGAKAAGGGADMEAAEAATREAEQPPPRQSGGIVGTVKQVTLGAITVVTIKIFLFMLSRLC